MRRSFGHRVFNKKLEVIRHTKFRPGENDFGSGRNNSVTRIKGVANQP